MPSMEMTSSKWRPTTTSERIVTLEVLRGIALFGVLTANIWLWFSGVNFLFPGVASELQRLSIDSVAFSLLFGLGFVSAFAPVGRMALTNYLSQTLICLAIYYAGGLVGDFRPALGVLIAIIIFVAQMGVSAWWLERFRFGPAEWLWRSLTYGQMQPMQVRKAAAAMPA